MCACAGSGGAGVLRGLQQCGVGGDRDVCAVGAERAEGTPAAARGRPAGRAAGAASVRARQRRGAGKSPRGRVELALEAALVTGGRPLPP